MRHASYIVLMILLAITLWILMLYGEIYWLEDRVVPLAGTKLPEWLDSFKWWASAGIAGTFFLSSLPWYLLGQWAFKFNQWGRNHRPIWLVLLLVPLMFAFVGCLFTKQTIEGAGWAYIFYFLNNLGTFYLGTALFSAAPVMYVPAGASYLRRW